MREKFRNRKGLSLVLAAVFFVLAGAVVAYQNWPAKRANLAMSFFTDDEGQTWFSAASTNLAPFDHDGKTAVMAEIFTYDSGNKKICGYLQKYTPEAKRRLEAAFADAKSHGQPLENVALFHDHGFMDSAFLVKKPGLNNPWVPYSDPRANQVLSVQSPDGSAVDQCFVY
ncbi:MAG TPA: hypothetical protein VG722_11660 [Tepidisphaeraceae bacterium]|nr:hypothetical protein [Tepidisphaeraceae bacterium]